MADTHGITCSQQEIDKLIGELHDYDVAERMLGGMSKANATYLTEHTLARQGQTRGSTKHPSRTVWQIHDSRIQELKDWIEHDKGWVSATNWDRMKAEGVTISADRLDLEIAKLSRTKTAQRSITGGGEDEARLYVSHFIARKHTSEQGNPVWQIHSDFIPELLNQIHTPNPWVNSHERTRLRESFGLRLPAVLLDPILDAYYPFLIQDTYRTLSKADISTTRADAAKYVDQHLMHRAESRGRKPSWDLHENFIPTLIAAKQELQPRREEDWIPIASGERSHAAGIRASKKIESRAAALFSQQQIERFKAVGATDDEARRYVADRIVKQATGDRAQITWKVHTAHMEDYKAVLEALPHREHYASRTGEGVLSGNEADTPPETTPPSNVVRQIVMRKRTRDDDKERGGNDGGPDR